MNARRDRLQVTPGTRVQLVIDGIARTGTVVTCPVSHGAITGKVHVHVDSSDGWGLDVDSATLSALTVEPTPGGAS